MPAEKSIVARAIELGWMVAGQPTADHQSFGRRAAALTALIELAALVDHASGIKWGLARLELDVGQDACREVIATATFQRRLEAAIGAATTEALRRRQAAGIRLGRRPLIPDTVLAQIASARKAGRSYGKIAQDLQAAGVPTAQGGREWRASTVWAAHRRATRTEND